VCRNATAGRSGYPVQRESRTAPSPLAGRDAPPFGCGRIDRVHGWWDQSFISSTTLSVIRDIVSFDIGAL
jgi:hypothetical protein